MEMRYTMRLNENEYIKWIQWTAGVIPHVVTNNFDKAMIVDDDYLSYIIGKMNKSRKELIVEKYPDVEILEVEVTLK